MSKSHLQTSLTYLFFILCTLGSLINLLHIVLYLFPTHSMELPSSRLPSYFPVCIQCLLFIHPCELSSAFVDYDHFLPSYALFTYHLIFPPTSLTNASCLKPRLVDPKDSKDENKDCLMLSPQLYTTRVVDVSCSCYQMLCQRHLVGHWIFPSNSAYS